MIFQKSFSAFSIGSASFNSESAVPASVVAFCSFYKTIRRIRVNIVESGREILTDFAMSRFASVVSSSSTSSFENLRASCFSIEHLKVVFSINDEQVKRQILLHSLRPFHFCPAYINCPILRLRSPCHSGNHRQPNDLAVLEHGGNARVHRPLEWTGSVRSV